MRFNHLLKIAIIGSGRTQREIAANTGIPENRLSTVIHGWVEPRDEERQAIAAALGRRVDELFESNATENEQRQAAGAAPAA